MCIVSLHLAFNVIRHRLQERTSEAQFVQSVILIVDY